MLYFIDIGGNRQRISKLTHLFCLQFIIEAGQVEIATVVGFFSPAENPVSTDGHVEDLLYGDVTSLRHGMSRLHIIASQVHIGVAVTYYGLGIISVAWWQNRPVRSGSVPAAAGPCTAYPHICTVRS